jgi:hypothetical protein
MSKSIFFDIFWWCGKRVKAHYGDPLRGTFGSSIIIHTIKKFQKYGTFNFGYQFWFLGPTITKLLLCNFQKK